MRLLTTWTQRAQPSSTAPAFCYSDGACEDSPTVRPRSRCQAASRQRRVSAHNHRKCVLSEKWPRGSPVRWKPSSPGPQPHPAQSQVTLDCRPCGIFRGENCERQVTTRLPPEMPTVTPGPRMRCSRKSTNPSTEADKWGE